MRKFILFFLTLLMLLPSCTKIRDDIPIQLLAQSVGEEIKGFENMAQASRDYLEYCMGDLEPFEEYIVLYPFAGTEYNEIGIFKIRADIDKQEAQIRLEKYLTFKRKNWDTRYKGDEFAKIENASITSCGRYVLYAILDDAERAAVSKRFQAEIKK